MGRQSRTGGRSWAAQFGTEIKGQDGRGSCCMQLGVPLPVGDRFGQAGADRIGRLAVIEDLDAGLPFVLAQ